MSKKEITKKELSGVENTRLKEELLTINCEKKICEYEIKNLKLEHELQTTTLKLEYELQITNLKLEYELKIKDLELQIEKNKNNTINATISTPVVINSNLKNTNVKFEKNDEHEKNDLNNKIENNDIKNNLNLERFNNYVDEELLFLDLMKTNASKNTSNEKEITLTQTQIIPLKPKKNKKTINTTNDVGIIFIKNPMLNYIDENAYKIACCHNYDNSIFKECLNCFIEPCEVVEYISVSKIINDETKTVKEKVEIGKKIISIVFNTEIICGYKQRYCATAIITKEKFENKIKELIEKISNYTLEIETYDKNILQYEKVNTVIYKNIQYIGDELFKMIQDNEIKDIIKTFSNTHKKFSEKIGKLMAYSVKMFKYYGENVCCIDIAIKEISPYSSYAVVSEYENNLMLNHYENYKASITLPIEKLIIYLITYFSKSLFLNTQTGKNLYLKTSMDEINECFNEIEKNKDLFELTIGKFIKQVNKNTSELNR